MGQFSAEMAWPQQTPCCLVSYLTYCPKHKVCDNMSYVVRLWPECYDFDPDHAQGMTMPATARPMSH